MKNRWRVVGAAVVCCFLLVMVGRAGDNGAGKDEQVQLRILIAEDQRRYGEDIAALLKHYDPSIRERAALAAGRIGDPQAVGALVELLEKDVEERVRAMAAFALGEIEAEEAAGALLAVLKGSSSPEVRARSLEAIGKIAAAVPNGKAEVRAKLREAVVESLGAELARQPGPDRLTALLGLTAALRSRHPGVPEMAARFLSSPDARIRADAENALTRVGAKNTPEVNGTLRKLLVTDADAIVRANAARALGVAADPEAGKALVKAATQDGDLRVRVSALRALAQVKDDAAGEALLKRGRKLFGDYKKAQEKGTRHPAEVNELLEIAAALGRVPLGTNVDEAVDWLKELRKEEEYTAPEIEVAYSRIGPEAYLNEYPLTELAGKARVATTGRVFSWQTQAAIARGLATYAAENAAGGSELRGRAEGVLASLLTDTQTLVRAAPEILRAYAAFKPDNLVTILQAYLTADDVIVRATAASLLAALPADSTTTDAVMAAFAASREDTQNDAALAMLDALAAQKSEQSLEAIRTGLASPDHLVRRRAAGVLKAAGLAFDANNVGPVQSRFTLADYHAALARRGVKPLAEVTTEKGTFTIELLADDAPLTVHNFIQLAEKHYFDRVTVHRVVPNFVIQDGDPRGDGEGGPGWQIRCEINMVPYDRGVVGMALAGKDTGGSQWFVTHSPQPHLDGGYTVFGRVVAGMEVADAIARGDIIRSVTIREAGK